MKKLDSISLSGFKSIGAEQNISFGDVTILLGANGAGKSNLVAFFRMLNYMTTNGLQVFIAQNGLANAILHFGSSQTQTISFQLDFSGNQWRNSYIATLAFGMPDALFFSGERIIAHQSDHNRPIDSYLQSAGRMESALNGDLFENKTVENSARVIKSILGQCKVFQFHDTSPSSRLRNSCNVETIKGLYSDAGNLPAFLYAMKRKVPQYYRRIVEYIKMMVPQFQDFILEPSINNEHNIFLNWIGEKGEEYMFGPHQLSDGSLRYMALTSLLLQPPDTLPQLIILDEPELGLHPAAIDTLAEMIKLAKKNCQIIVATQSAKLANHFSPAEIVVANYDKIQHESHFTKLDMEKLKDWLKDYASIEELWDRNIIGGRP